MNLKCQLNKQKVNRMNIKFIEKEQIWDLEQTRYWFDVDGVEWCLADENGDVSLLDKNGEEIIDCNDHEGIKQKLIPQYEQLIWG